MRLRIRRCFAALVVAATAFWILANTAYQACAEELYVVGYADNLVRRFDAITGASLGIFATLPTNTLGPTHPLFGADGNLYVQQEQQYRIMKVNGTTGAALPDFVPQNQSLLPLPYTQRFHNGSLFVGNFFSDTADTHGNIVRFDATTGAYQGVFATMAGFEGGFDFGPDGNLYVGIRNLNRVDEFDGTTGAFIKTVVGNVFADFNASNNFFYGPSHLEFGSDGFMYVSRFAGQPGIPVVMNRFTAGGTPLGTVINDSYFSNRLAGQFVFAPNGVIDILDEGSTPTNGSIRQYSLATGAFIGTLAANIPNAPVGMTLRPTVKNVTALVQITRSAYRFNFSTQTYVQRVTIKNTSAAPIAGPISLVLDNLSAGTALTAVNGSTSSVAPYGSPYVNFVLSGTSLAPGGTTTVSLEFIDPSNTLIAYTPRILAGTGSR